MPQATGLKPQALLLVPEFLNLYLQFFPICASINPTLITYSVNSTSHDLSLHANIN